MQALKSKKGRKPSKVKTLTQELNLMKAKLEENKEKRQKLEAQLKLNTLKTTISRARQEDIKASLEGTEFFQF